MAIDICFIIFIPFRLGVVPRENITIMILESQNVVPMRMRAVAVAPRTNKDLDPEFAQSVHGDIRSITRSATLHSAKDLEESKKAEERITNIYCNTCNSNSLIDV